MIALSLLAVTSVGPVNGVWTCQPSGTVFAASWRLQTGEKTLTAEKPEEFRYQGFEFEFADDVVTVRMRDRAELMEQRVPYFRQRNYLTFNFNEGLTETGWARPLTIWTNEASQSVARYEVSFPLSLPRAIKTMSGHNIEAGDAAMAVAALSCKKKTTP